MLTSRSIFVDERVVYGMRCVWWDGIENVGTLDHKESVHGLPCCPFCRGVLMQVDNPKVWWEGVNNYEKAGHPGYRAFMEWLKGKCYPTMRAAQEVYQAKKGRTVVI
jgi:hypothetical protein